MTSNFGHVFSGVEIVIYDKKVGRCHYNEKVFSTADVYDFPLTWKWDIYTVRGKSHTSAVYDPFSITMRYGWMYKLKVPLKHRYLVRRYDSYIKGIINIRNLGLGQVLCN